MIRKHNETSTVIPAATVIELVKILDKKDRNICQALSASAFSIILEALLHAEHCKYLERGLLILTVSENPHIYTTPLSYQAALYQNSSSVRRSQTQKSDIGKECLDMLLEFFTDAARSSVARRWV